MKLFMDLIYEWTKKLKLELLTYDWPWWYFVTCCLKKILKKITQAKMNSLVSYDSVGVKIPKLFDDAWPEKDYCSIFTDGKDKSGYQSARNVKIIITIYAQKFAKNGLLPGFYSGRARCLKLLNFENLWARAKNAFPHSEELTKIIIHARVIITRRRYFILLW